MIRRSRGFLSKLKDRVPISRAAARQWVHSDLIGIARDDVTKVIMGGTLHALSKKDEPIQPPEKAWWKAQSVKWETIWKMVNEVCVRLDEEKLGDLQRLSDIAFRLYEQLTVNSMTTLHGVSSVTLRTEGLRWRETGIIIASLHRYCCMDDSRRVMKERKNAPFSGIKEMKEG